MIIILTSLSEVVKTPVYFVVHRGSIPRQRELLELNTSFHKTTDSTIGVHIFRKTKTGQKRRKLPSNYSFNFRCEQIQTGKKHGG